MAKTKIAKKWTFTPSRRASLRKAQKVHVEICRLGRVARARGNK